MSSNLNCPPDRAEMKKGAAPDQENAPSETTPQQDHNANKADGATSGILKSRSTNTQSQRARALELLKASPQTTYSLRKKGISHPAQRLKELIRDGHFISSTRVNAIDSDGYIHVGVALYSLGKPASNNDQGAA